MAGTAYCQPFTDPSQTLISEHVASLLPILARHCSADHMPTVDWPSYSYLSANHGQATFCWSSVNCPVICLYASITGGLLSVCFCLYSHTGTAKSCFCQAAQKLQIHHIMRAITGVLLSICVTPVDMFTSLLPPFLLPPYFLDQSCCNSDKGHLHVMRSQRSPALDSTASPRWLQRVGEWAVLFKAIQSGWMPSACDSKRPRHQNSKGVATTILRQ